MTELEKIRAEIVERKDDAHRRFEAAAVQWETAKAELAAHDRAVAAMDAPSAVDSPATRHSIQRPVMALLSGSTMGWSAELIVRETGLPDAAVRKFLGRAVKAKLLTYGGGLYKMPTVAISEAAQ